MTKGRRVLWILLTFQIVISCWADEGQQWTTAPNMAAPVLNLHRKEMTVVAGTDLIISCMGTSNLTWTSPDVRVVSPTASSRRTILNNQTGHEGYLSIFRLTKVQYSDTGLYTCMYANSGTDQRTSSTEGSTSVYIFVPDNDHLYAPPTRDTIDGSPLFSAVHASRPYVMPCLPTHPRTNVTLWKGSEQVQLGRDVTFDRKTGFTIHYPTRYYNHIFKCRFAFNGTSQDLTVLLTFRVSAQIPQPEIDASHERSILVGETLKLKCHVKVPQGTMVFIEWSYPSGEHSNRIRITPSTRQSLSTIDYHYDQIERTLVVKDVNTVDSGIYKCLVTTHDEKSNHREVAVEVHEKTFVHLTPMSRVVETRLGTGSVYLSMAINAYPRPNITWYRHGEPVSEADRHKDVRTRSDRTKLKLFNVGAPDAGDYVVRAISRDMNDTATVTLIVTEPATVSRLISPNDTKSLLVDKLYTIVCEFTGVPQAKVSWAWQPCLTMGCTPNPNKWMPITNSSNLPQESKTKNETKINVIARESGFYQCTASNKMGTDARFMPFYVSDVKGGFALSAHNLMPVEGDKFVLTCQSNALIFSLPRMYIERDNQLILITNSSTLTLTQHSTTYSHVLVLVIEYVELSDSGKYYCQSENKFGERHRDSTDIQVKGMEIPQWTKSLDHNMLYIMKPGAVNSIECRAVGEPTPTIHWYKDDIPLNETALHYKLSRNNSKLSFKSNDMKTAVGIYSCEATNRAGSITSNTTVNINFPGKTNAVTEEGLSKVHIGMIVGVIILILIFIIVITIITRRHCQPRYYSDEYLLASKTFNPDLPIDIQPDCIAYDPKWEFPRDRLTFGMLLGQGAFGKVVRAEAFGIGFNGMETTTTIVAVKMPKDFSDADQMKALLSELKVLIHIGQHLNIVNLLGACTKDMRKGVLYVIVEYCRYGNLLNYLLKKREKFVDTMSDRRSLASTNTNGSLTKGDLFLEPGREYVNTSAQPVREDDEPPDLGPLTTKDLLCYAFQIARGMDYLASRKYIHRDLAARNVLLADGGIVKIADFGLAKDCYKYDEYQKKTNGPVPVKWLALESLTHKVYTTKSDVWSYGVLLWELFTVGGNPYPGVIIDETFVERLKNGFRMERPPYASEQIYGTMLQCWAYNPETRPDFAELANRFGNLLQASVRQHYIDLETMIGQMTPERSTTGYLRMAGSTLTSYVPMSSDPGESARTLPEPEASNIIPENDSGFDYSELQHMRQPQYKEYNSPTVETVNECDELDSLDNAESLVNNNNNGSNKDITLETTAMVHSLPPSDSKDNDQDPVDPSEGSDSSPFLTRTDSDKSDTSGPRRGRRNLKGHDSVSSDASSGFHSCYYPDDSPTDYPNGLIMNGIPPKEVMV